jgi:hypothetical protein
MSLARVGQVDAYTPCSHSMPGGCSEHVICFRMSFCISYDSQMMAQDVEISFTHCSALLVMEAADLNDAFVKGAGRTLAPPSAGRRTAATTAFGKGSS